MAKIKLTKEQQKYAALGVLLLGGFGYSYFMFFWSPVSQRIADTKKKTEEVEAKIEKATRQAARLPRLEAELVELSQKAVEAERRLPKNKSVPDILVTLSGLADKHHVSLLSFTPGGQTDKPFFIELSYPISVRGSYHNIGRFLAGLALEERIFNVQNVVYAEPGPDGQMQISFTLISYQYKG
ncbi:MAG: type 4a pilus biogenesis protein PilO [Elusimicrobia bacterium]|nr:type 4a pilus biogenesis protein PilO [Elusimicrobiota bacterium]